MRRMPSSPINESTLKHRPDRKSQPDQSKKASPLDRAIVGQ